MSRAKEDVTQNSVIVHEINIGDCFNERNDDWPRTKYFGSLIIELIDVSLLILTLNDV